jgi:predicted aldo/keto reductase-like oxidoreductase
MAEGGAVPAGIADHYRQLDVKASACVQCGGCEERCPFGVPVRERMEKTAALFGE